MALNQFAFPVSFPLEDVSSALQQWLEAKGWKNFQQGNISLSYTPYYFFSYDFFTETENEDSKQKVVDNTDIGNGALNASTGELNDDLYALLEENEPQKIEKPEQDYPFEVERLALGEKDAMRLLPLKLSQQQQLPRQNFSISSIQLVYVPIWTAAFELDGQGFEVQYNAVNGEIVQEAEIPFHKKGFIDLTWETLGELKQPNKWIEYSHSVAADVFHSEALHAMGRPFVHDRRVQYAVLAVLVVLAILWFYRII